MAANLGHVLYESKKGADVVFLIDGQEIFAHRVVLSVDCPYFDTMLFGATNEAKMARIELKNTPSKAFKEIIRYCYLRELKIQDWKEEEVVELLTLAHEYQMNALVKLAEDELREKHVNPDNLDLMFNVAVRLDQSELLEHCMTMAERNVDQTLEVNNFASYSGALLSTLMERTTFKEHKQDQLLGGIAKWKTCHNSDELKWVLKKINWKKVSPTLLSELTEELVDKLDCSELRFWDTVTTYTKIVQTTNSDSSTNFKSLSTSKPTPIPLPHNPAPRLAAYNSTPRLLPYNTTPSLPGSNLAPMLLPFRPLPSFSGFIPPPILPSYNPLVSLPIPRLTPLPIRSSTLNVPSSMPTTSLPHNKPTARHPTTTPILNLPTYKSTPTLSPNQRTLSLPVLTPPSLGSNSKPSKQPDNSDLQFLTYTISDLNLKTGSEQSFTWELGDVTILHKGRDVRIMFLDQDVHLESISFHANWLMSTSIRTVTCNGKQFKYTQVTSSSLLGGNSFEFVLDVKRVSKRRWVHIQISPPHDEITFKDFKIRAGKAMAV